MKNLEKRVRAHAKNAWLEQGHGSDMNPYEMPPCPWAWWAQEWGTLEDAHNDMAASDDDRNTATLHRWPDFARDENL